MIIIPSILEGFRSLVDRTLKLTFTTNEATPEQMLGISQSLQQFGYLAFKIDKFKEKEIKVFNELEASYEDKTKTHSVRLRNVFYRCWEQEKEGFEDFDSYYKFNMERVIDHFKSKLNLKAV